MLQFNRFWVISKETNLLIYHDSREIIIPPLAPLAGLEKSTMPAMTGETEPQEGGPVEGVLSTAGVCVLTDLVLARSERRISARGAL
jgi:hypothetical protein